MMRRPSSAPAPSLPLPPPPPAGRGIFCNRTLNVRSIRAIGYDMDYTLIHYQVERWELRAFEHLTRKLLDRGWPVQPTRFDPRTFIRGLVFDTELGNVIKANRFGFVKQARHGTRLLSYEQQRAIYARTIVDLSDPRFVFANTLFELAKGSMYAQLVDLLDEGHLTQVRGYRELFGIIKRSLDEAHMEGELKAEILARPDEFVDLDPEMPATLLDQKQAGKKLLLISNAEWSYVRPMMTYAFDRFLPRGMRWRELFDIVIVGAGKPHFFSGRSPLFEVVDEQRGLLVPAVTGLREGAFVGGNAQLVEAHLGLSGDEILYVGDHIYADVEVTKKVLRWRTALVVRELEEEMAALERFTDEQRQLSELMHAKEQFEIEQCQLRLLLQRLTHGDAAPDSGAGPAGCDAARPGAAGDPGAPCVTGPALKAPAPAADDIHRRLQQLRSQSMELDQHIGPLAHASGELANASWGLLLRAGNDKSQMARQVERYADVYTSRVSNFLYRTPFVYLRGPHATLPHDVALARLASAPAPELHSPR